MNTKTMVCSVNGTGPNGTVTQALTARSAMAKPQNATVSVRLSVVFFINLPPYVVGSKTSGIVAL